MNGRCKGVLASFFTFMLIVGFCEQFIGNKHEACQIKKEIAGRILKSGTGRPSSSNLTADDSVLRILKNSNTLLESLDIEHQGERIHYSLLGKEIAKDALTNSYQANKRITGQPELLSLFPRNENEYQLVYGEVSARAAAKVKEYEKLANRTERVKVLSLRTPDNLFSQIARSEGNLIVLLGHSISEGRELVLQSGKGISIDFIHRKCMDLMKYCLVLTCYGDDFSLYESISAFDALNMFRATIAKLKDQPDLKLDDFVTTMRQERLHQRTHNRIAIGWRIVIAGSALGYVATSVGNRVDPASRGLEIVGSEK